MTDAANAHGRSITHLRIWSAEEFAGSCREWESLLACSSANPLFMSWAWQHAWWSECADVLGSKLQIYAGYSASGQLVGLAPLQMRRVMQRAPVFITRLESLGSSWRHNATVFSEYLDFIVHPEYEPAFLQALAAQLREDGRWHELVIANSPISGCAARFVHEYLRDTSYLRTVDMLSAHRTDLPQRFGDYLANLSGGTRRKLWNHRRRLREPRLELYAETDIDAFLDELDDFHERRWGKRHFLGKWRTFHRTYAHAMARNGALRMSRLDEGQDTISLMYNVRLDGTEYNIQSGFSGASSSGISPGYLHFGYCLEQACNDGVRHFDFLAGAGRSRDYKGDFNTHKVGLNTLHAVRARPLAWLYKQHDRLRARSSAM